MTVGEFVRQKRMERGLNLTEVARISGLSQGLLSRIENNKQINLEWFTILRLERALRLKKGELYKTLTESLPRHGV